MIASFASPERPVPAGAGHSGSDGSGPFAVSSAPAGAPLASLAGDALARRFYGWRGASGARYVVTVHGVESEGWTQIDAAVVVIVAVDLDGVRRIVGVEADPSPRRRDAIRAAAQAGAARGVRFEAHLHLLAETAARRAAVVADLARAVLA
jgi:hypothetical protein